MNYIISDYGLGYLTRSLTENAVLTAMKIRRPADEFASEAQILPWIALYGFAKKDLHRWEKEGQLSRRKIKNRFCYSAIEVSNLISKAMSERYLHIVRKNDDF